MVLLFYSVNKPALAAQEAFGSALESVCVQGAQHSVPLRRHNRGTVAAWLLRSCRLAGETADKQQKYKGVSAQQLVE